LPYTILYHHRTRELDGQRVHIREVQDALRRLGHDVIEVAPLPAREAAGSAETPTLRRRIFNRAARLARGGAYEALEWAYNGPGFVALARAVGRHRPDFIYERYALNTVAGAMAARRFGLPLLLEVNSPLADERREQGRVTFHRVARSLERYVFRQATRVLPVTQVLARRVESSSALSPDRVVVVPNGVRPELFEAARAARERVRRVLQIGDGVVVGAVAFFLDWHGIDVALRSVAALRQAGRRVLVLLVGDGPALPSLRAIAVQEGIADVVRFEGAVPHDRIPGYLAAMDVAVIPRAVEYASPLKLFEYMSAGLPILGPRQDSLLEVLVPDRDGLLFEPENARDFARLLGALVDDPAMRLRLGRAARAAIHERGFTWDAHARRIVDVFERARSTSEISTSRAAASGSVARRARVVR
jgi:glycosyltransferase involved in cell wall biosynthesis